MSRLHFYECRGCLLDHPCTLVSDDIVTNPLPPTRCPCGGGGRCAWHHVETREVSDDVD